MSLTCSIFRQCFVKSIVALAFFCKVFAFDAFVKAQGSEYAAGAKSMAMAGASVANQDEYAFSNNPAGAASCKILNISFLVQNKFMVSNMNSLALLTVFPVHKNISLGVNFHKFGDLYYSEQRIGIGLASNIKNVSLGTQFHVLQVRMDEVSTQWTWIGEFGGIASISEKIKWGAHVWNLNNASLATKRKSELPVLLRTGVSYQPIQKVQVNIEISKQIDYNPSLNVGLEYMIIRWMALRTGVNTALSKICIGFGVVQKKWKLDYAINSSSRLGYSHQFSLTWILSKKQQFNKE
ncbi:MAG: hypothetical protein EAZ07_01250 [Cytophagales bacterium]|nr:MAG: hypothetical protein EAZ07_01250 [Cytophagales bacterium]